MEKKEINQKPRSVSIAINLLITSTIVMFVNSIIGQVVDDNQQFSNEFALLTVIFTLGYMFFFISKLSARKNWARITFLIIFILGMLMLPFTLTPILKHTPVVATLSLSVSMLQIVALFFLFTKESNSWYGAKKQNP